MLAPVFIRGEKYGTRAGTLASFRNGASVALYERSFASGGVVGGEVGWISERGERFADVNCKNADGG